MTRNGNPKVANPQAKRSKNGKKKNKRRNRKTKKLSLYARMIAQPCDSTLVPGMYGSTQGMLSRVHTSGNVVSANTYAYFLWFPSYCCNWASSTTTSTPVNFVYFTTNTPATGPTVADYGHGAVSTTASSWSDPAYDLSNSDMCADMRTLGACLRVQYTGSTSASKGMIYPLHNVPLEAVLSGGSGDTPASVTNLQRYANSAIRAVDKCEIVWRPTPDAMNFRRDDEGIINPSGTAGGNTTLSSYAVHAGTTGFGFVLWNVTSITDYVVESYKNVEWRAEPNSGFTYVQPKGADNPNLLAKVLGELDSKIPSWQNNLVDMATTGITNAIAKIALGGSSSYYPSQWAIEM
jgi:hypothetical protein